MAAADSVGGMVAFPEPPRRGVGDVDGQLGDELLRGLREGHVEAVGRPVHVGRTTIVVETDLRGPHDRLLARVTQTQAVLR